MREKSNKKSVGEITQVNVVPTKAFEIKPNHKYLMIMPKDAQLNQFANAFKVFAPNSPIFILAVNDINQVKLAELMGENERPRGD